MGAMIKLWVQKIAVKKECNLHVFYWLHQFLSTIVLLLPAFIAFHQILLTLYFYAHFFFFFALINLSK